MKHNIWFLKWQICYSLSSTGFKTSSAFIRDTDEHEDVDKEVDDVGVDGEGGEGLVLEVVAVLVGPKHHHLSLVRAICED